MAPIADERLAQVAAVVEAKKITPAAVRVVDVPGTGAALLGNLRQVDAILAVLDGYSADATPDDDLETLQLELLVADRDHVDKRLDRVRSQAKSGDPQLRAEVAELEKLLAHVDAGGRLADYGGELPPELEPLTTKAIIPLVNGPAGIDGKLEAELAELPEEEAAAFRDGTSALDEVVQKLFEALDLISFFTAGDKETRAWTLRPGETALDAASRDPHRHRAGIHPLRGDPLGRFRREGSMPRPRGGVCSGSRARRMSSRTATSSTCASTSSDAGGPAAPGRDGGCGRRGAAGRRARRLVGVGGS